MKRASGCDGVNIVQNNGLAAGQEVPHAHWHVIPRTAGDGLLRLPASVKGPISLKMPVPCWKRCRVLRKGRLR